MPNVIDRTRLLKEAISRAASARRMAAHYQAVELEHLASYARACRDEKGNLQEFAHLEIATRMHISDRSARQRLTFASTLAERLGQTLAALRSGRIEEYKALLVANAVDPLTDEQATLVEAQVLQRASNQTPTQLRRSLAAAVATVDPEGAEQRRQRKLRQRRVESKPIEDGQAMLTIVHSTDRIAAMHNLIATVAKEAKAAGGDDRTCSQIEADVAVDLVLGANSENRTVEVHLTLPVSTAAGIDDRPGEIDGLGSITAAAARQLASEASTWRWIRTDPATGELRDLTQPRHQPPKALVELIKVRDRTCRFPGCNRPARHSDIDHTTPWPAGRTTDTNLGALCRYHHRAKHQGKWLLRQLRAGHFRWTSPLGYSYRVGPEPVAGTGVDASKNPPVPNAS